MSETEKTVTERDQDLRRTVLDDRVVRWIGVPFFGLVIPSAVGLVELVDFSIKAIVVQYVYFILIAWAVWDGNRYLLFRFYPVIFGSHSLFQKYLLMTGLNIFFTAPVSLLMLYCWKWAAGADHIGASAIVVTVAVIVVCVIFVTNFYEKVLFAKHNEWEKVRIEQLERAKIEAELQALKNQIDPHFMFNILNSISFLVDHDPKKAQQFIEKLAELYRYILRSKDDDLVLLRDEIAFLKSYASLMEMRHENALQVNLNLNESTHSEYLIPPVSMMVAVENAVKHNAISKSHRLVVNIEQRDNGIVITNKISRRKPARESTKTGLKNLDERFRRILGKGIEVISESGIFTLQLPLLRLD